MIEMTDHLAAQEMTIGRYYLKHVDLIPAINRFKNVIENYSDSNQVPEAYYRLTVSYLMLGVDKAAQKTSKTMIKKYPDNSWTEKVKKVLEEK